MRKLVIVIGGLLLLLACSESIDEKPNVKSAVEGYYQSLMDSDYVTFTDGMAGKAQLPEEYHKQYVKLSEQFAKNQQEKHGGILSATTTIIQLNETQDSGYVCMELSFADSLSEEVLVPMVKIGDKWYMQ